MREMHRFSVALFSGSISAQSGETDEVEQSFFLIFLSLLLLSFFYVFTCCSVEVKLLIFD